MALALPLAAHVTISGGVEDGTGKSIARLYFVFTFFVGLMCKFNFFIRHNLKHQMLRKR